MVRHFGRNSRGITTLGGLAVVLSLAGCGVKQDAVNSDLAQLREELQQEITAGDERVAAQANDRIEQLGQQLASLDRELQSFRQDFNAKLTRMEARLALDVPVHFEFDKATIRGQDQPMLERFAQVMKEHHPNVLITVEGFADPAGPVAYNQWLGLQRAEAVRTFLVERGLPAERIRAVSYGEARNRQVVPGAGGPGERGLPNRRVAFVIEYADAAQTHLAVQGSQ